MLLPNAPNCLSVTIVGLKDTAVWNNKLHFQFTGGDPASTDLFSFNNAILAAYTTQFLPLCNPNVSIRQVNTVVLSTRTAPTAYSTEPSPPVGLRTGTATSAQVACAVSWGVNLRYRGGHARTYLPAGNISDIQSGRLWTDTFWDEANTAADDFLDDVNGITVGAHTFSLILLSYFSGSHKTPENPHPDPVPRPAPAPFPVVSSSVHRRVDTQRRRLGKEPL